MFGAARGPWSGCQLLPTLHRDTHLPNRPTAQLRPLAKELWVLAVRTDLGTALTPFLKAQGPGNKAE